MRIGKAHDVIAGGDLLPAIFSMADPEATMVKCMYTDMDDRGPGKEAMLCTGSDDEVAV